MSIVWDYRCYQCHNPINLRFEYETEDQVDAFIKFKKQLVFSTVHNSMFYKFYGLKVKRVCYSCFSNKIHVSPKILRDREIGLKVKMVDKSYSKTENNIFLWNRLFRRYLKNSV